MLRYMSGLEVDWYDWDHFTIQPGTWVGASGGPVHEFPGGKFNAMEIAKSWVDGFYRLYIHEDNSVVMSRSDRYDAETVNGRTFTRKLPVALYLRSGKLIQWQIHAGGVQIWTAFSDNDPLFNVQVSRSGIVRLPMVPEECRCVLLNSFSQGAYRIKTPGVTSSIPVNGGHQEVNFLVTNSTQQVEVSSIYPVKLGVRGFAWRGPV